MKLFEEFKLYETMWEESETTKTNNSLENLKTALIDSFSAKGYTDEVAILTKCTLKDATEIKAKLGGKCPVVMLTTDNTLYLHPALTKPENFNKASLAVRVEFAYKILGIKLSNKSDFTDIRKGLAAIRARLTKSEIALAKNFILDGEQYMLIRSYNTRKNNTAANTAMQESAVQSSNLSMIRKYLVEVGGIEFYAEDMEDTFAIWFLGHELGDESVGIFDLDTMRATDEINSSDAIAIYDDLKEFFAYNEEAYEVCLEVAKKYYNN